MLKGITVQLISKVQTGTDPFKRPIYEEVAEDIEDVLVAPVGSTEQLEVNNLTGKKAVYTLAIPKGDTHIWEGQKVQFFGETWNVIQFPTEGIDDLIPLRWNRKVVVERNG